MLTIRLVLFTLFATAITFSQATIQGTISDSTSKEILVGANVLVVGTALGSVTDIEGQFKITRVPAGKISVRISYLGYKSKILQVSVEDKQTIVVNAALYPDVVQGNEVVITAQARGQNAAINQQLTSRTIVSVVSEEKIKELPDANAAEAIGRLPGVSLLRSGGEASKVILRGMSDKFTTVTIDGVRIPPTDADSRGVDLSTLSQGSLAGIELFKALTSDKDGDAIAGTVNLVTRKAPVEPELRIDAKGGYNKLDASFKQYDISGKYGQRFFDNLLGLQITGNSEQRIRSKENLDADWAFDTDANTKIDNNLRVNDLNVAYTNEIRKRNGLSAIFDFNTPDSGSIKLSSNYSMTKRDYIVQSRNYPLGNADLVYDFHDKELNINTTNVALNGNNYLFDVNVTWGASFAESKNETPYDYEMSFLEPSTAQSKMRPQPGPITSIDDVIQYAYNNFSASYADWGYYNHEQNYDKENALFINLSKKYTVSDYIDGELKFGGKLKTKSRWKSNSELWAAYYLGYYGYQLTGNGVAPVDLSGTRFASIQGGNFVYLSNFIDSPIPDRNILDKYRLYPVINRQALLDWYSLNGNNVESSGKKKQFLENPSFNGDYYDITERVNAGYIMNTLTFGQEITFIAGVRFEQEKNDYRSHYFPDTFGGFGASASFKDTASSFNETIILPNFQFLIKPSEYLNLRLAAYKALARPDYNFRLAKFISTSANNGTLTMGNDNIKTAKAWNYELNTSFFSNSIGLISISVFYKNIDDMFHLLSSQLATRSTLQDSIGTKWNNKPPGGNYRLTIPYTSPLPTKVWGFEFEDQANLNYLPGYLQYLVLSFNFSIVRSESHILSDNTYNKNDSVFIPDENIWQKTPITIPSTHLIKTKLENQPEFYGNLAIGYDISDFSARLSLFYQGEFAISYSYNGKSDLYQEKFTRLDLSLKQKITPNISVMLNINNLTNIYESTTVRNSIMGWTSLNTAEKYGMTGDLGVRIEF